MEAETSRSIVNTLRMHAWQAALLASILAFPHLCFSAVTAAQRAKAVAAFDQASDMRAALEAEPETRRTKAEYLRTIQTFDLVPRLDPAYAKTPAALNAIAELYEEMGRIFSTDHWYRSAIKTYEFLASNYPQNRLSRDALFAIGEIYRSDLENPEEARKAFQEYLKQHSKAEKSSEARAKLRELDHLLAERASVETHPARLLPEERRPAGLTKPFPSQALLEERRPTGPPEVTAIRRWVGPNYSRIVIGVEGEVKFETVRLANPDRIVLDLQNSRLSSELVGKTFPIEDGFLRQIRVAQFTPSITRVVLDVEKIEDYSVIPLPNPFRLVIDIHGTPTQLVAKAEAAGREKPLSGRSSSELSTPPSPISSNARPERATSSAKQPIASVSPPDTKVAVPKENSKGTLPGKESGTEPDGRTEVAANIQKPKPKIKEELKETAKSSRNMTEEIAAAKPQPARRSAGETGPAPNTPKAAGPTQEGSRTLTRALGLKIGRIVIDPGHGGHDTGTIGPTGLEEKDVVLDVALRLAKLLEKDTGCTVILTRRDDTFIPLEERTAIANEKAADLFISIHANAGRDKGARGIETYYLNFTSSPDALEVAARENATTQESVHQLQDLIKKIAMTEKIEESQEFARQVQREVHQRLAKASGGAERDRGVKKAPFVVLIGANMPSILSEISFLTNPRDERLLKRGDYRQRVAEALYHGVLDYVNRLSGVTTAQRATAPGESSAAARSDF